MPKVFQIVSIHFFPYVKELNLFKLQAQAVFLMGLNSNNINRFDHLLSFFTIQVLFNFFITRMRIIVNYYTLVRNNFEINVMLFIILNILRA